MVVPLDELDIAILQHLQEDGRCPFSEIARSLNVSTGTVRNRVGRLTKAGLLKIVGWVEARAIGLNAPANIQIAIEPPHLLEEAAAAITAISEVTFVALMTGEYELTANVRCRDSEHLIELLTQRIQKVPGVARTRTNMYLRVYKFGPLDMRVVDEPARTPAQNGGRGQA